MCEVGDAINELVEQEYGYRIEENSDNIDELRSDVSDASDQAADAMEKIAEMEKQYEAQLAEYEESIIALETLVKEMGYHQELIPGGHKWVKNQPPQD